MLLLVGCGNGDNSNSPTKNAPANAATPGEVIKQFAEAMEAGDAETLKALMPDIEAKLGNNAYVLAARMADSAKAVGGVASVTIDDETIRGTRWIPRVPGQGDRRPEFTWPESLDDRIIYTSLRASWAQGAPDPDTGRPGDYRALS